MDQIVYIHTLTCMTTVQFSVYVQHLVSWLQARPGQL